MNNLIYQENKYLKYKKKYLRLKNTNNSIGGTGNLIKAIAFFNGDKVKGIVLFEETTNNNVRVKIDLSELEPNSTHGFHVHESGDLTKGCDSTCAHFNPYNKTHGSRDDIERHVGDLGNIIADSNGRVQMEFIDNLIKLRGDLTNIIGRGLVIHEDIDDCGKGSHPTSLTTGNSGKRIGCAIIGYASLCAK